MKDFKEQEIRHHDEITERLLKLSDREFRNPELRALYYQRTFISKMGKVLGKRLLECGVGSGLMACYFASKGAEVWGFDISPGMIEATSRRAKLWGVANRIHLKVMPFEETDYDDEFFDKAYGNFILHHVELDKAAAQLGRVLMRGGQALFQETFAGNTLLMFARRYIVGHFGIKRGSTSREKPLSMGDLENLKPFLKEVQVVFAEMYLWKLISRTFTMPGLSSLPKNWQNRIYDFSDLWDRATYTLFPLTRRFSYYVYIECVK